MRLFSTAQTKRRRTLCSIKLNTRKMFSGWATDPFAFKRAERAFIESTSSLFVSTTIAIVGGLGLSVLIGIIVGFVFYFLSMKKRGEMQAFSDAGGMTRLNLDGLSAQTSSDRLLGEVEINFAHFCFYKLEPLLPRPRA